MAFNTKLKKLSAFSVVLLTCAAIFVLIFVFGLFVFLRTNENNLDDGQVPSPSSTVVLCDTITVGGWGTACELSKSDSSSAQTAKLGVTYGKLEKGTEISFEGVISDDGNVTEVWFHPLCGVFHENTGFIVRMDKWVIGGSPDGSFANSFSGLPIDGVADGSSSPLWSVYFDGDYWTSETAKGSSQYFVTYSYAVDGVLSIAQTIIDDAGVRLSQTYSSRVPDGPYTVFFYGENCSFTLFSMAVENINSAA